MLETIDLEPRGILAPNILAGSGQYVAHTLAPMAYSSPMEANGLLGEHLLHKPSDGLLHCSGAPRVHSLLIAHMPGHGIKEWDDSEEWEKVADWLDQQRFALLRDHTPSETLSSAQGPDPSPPCLSLGLHR